MSTEPENDPAGNMTANWERRQPVLWHWPRIIAGYKFTDDVWDVALGALVIIDDGFISVDCEAGQVWHRALRFTFILFWLKIRVSITSPHGRLMPYEDPDLAAPPSP